jgi:hypothetical protein
MFGDLDREISSLSGVDSMSLIVLAIVGVAGLGRVKRDDKVVGDRSKISGPIGGKRCEGRRNNRWPR